MLARVLQRPAQRLLRLVARLLVIDLEEPIDRLLHPAVVDVELLGEDLQEALAAVGAERQIGAAEGRRPGAGRDLPAPSLEAGLHLLAHLIRVLVGKVRTRRPHGDAARRVGDVAPGVPQVAQGAVEEASAGSIVHGCGDRVGKPDSASGVEKRRRTISLRRRLHPLLRNGTERIKATDPSWRAAA